MATKKVSPRRSTPKKTAAQKPASKKVMKQQSQLQRFKGFVGRHKLATFLLVLLLIWLGGLAYEKYKDWDNAQMIKGLARDFPALVAEIEAATGLDLEVKSNCMTTTEKYTVGIRTCELSAGYSGLNDAESKLGLVDESKYGLIQYGNVVNGNRNLKYRAKDSCDMWFAAKDKFYIRCLTGVRSANVQLVREVFSGR